MTLADELAAGVSGAVPAVEFGDAVVTVPAEWWAAAVEFARDRLGLTYLDMLTGTDDGETLGVVAYLWSPGRREGLLLRTQVPTAAPLLTSITPLLPGADWHERETAEMLGVVFVGHPRPGPLLLPDPPPGAPSHPLRKDAPLTRRLETPWPGAAG